jgi:adenylate cyclase
MARQDSNDEAMRLLKGALEIDPVHASAMGILLAVYANRRGGGFVSDAGRETAEVERLARQVVHIGQDDAVALGHAAFAIAYVLRDLAFAQEQVQRALMLNQNLASAWACSGYIQLWSGNPAKAAKDLLQAMRLDPLNDSGQWKSGLAHAYFFLDRHEDALRLANGMLQHNPDAHPALRVGAISAAFGGRPDLAQKLVSQLLRVDPAFQTSQLAKYLGPYPIEFVEKYKQGLLKAGLPE